MKTLFLPLIQIAQFFILRRLGWIPRKDAVWYKPSSVRFYDPNHRYPSNQTGDTINYCWYLTKMRVVNRSDTKYNVYRLEDLLKSTSERPNEAIY